MTKWFRSAEMEYVSIIVNEDAAHACVNDLGLLGIIQFTDLNHDQVAFQRRYVGYIKRCDELERKLRYIKAELNKFGLNTETPGGLQEFLSKHSAKEARSGAYELEQLENKLEGYEKQLQELNLLGEKMGTEFNEKMEYQEVLLKVQGFFSSDDAKPFEERERASSDAPATTGGDHHGKPLLVQPGADKDMRFSFMAGVLNEEDRFRFDRMLFRATKGNVYTRFAEINSVLTDPVTGELKKKLVYIIFYKSATIERKLTKICDAFNARRYPIPDLDDTSKVRQIIVDNAAELEDTRVVVGKNKDARFQLCKVLSQSWEEWMWLVVREKSIYHTLNMFKSDVSGMLRGEGWIVASGFQKARATMNEAHSRFESAMPCLLERVPLPWPTPPTYFETNKFTWAFQEFVDTYGVPRYREANPALFTAATFPFFFGIMYGDMGHGFVLWLLGLFLVLTEKRADARDGGGSLASLYPARYMLLLMGCFAMYAGLIYNEWFCLPIDLFGSKYSYHVEEVSDGAGGHIEEPKFLSKHPYGSYESVYPLGMDPAWRVSSNSLLFINSMKMKLSVILGIIHMTGGILLRGANNIYFKQYLDLATEFIPMIIFDLALFGYMVIAIFIKWSINWEERMLAATCFLGGLKDQQCTNAAAAAGECFVYNTKTPCVPGVSTTADMCPYDYGGPGDGCQPPNLVNTLISIALSPGTVTEPMFGGQDKLQVALLLIAFLNVPILLCAKPCVLKHRAGKKKGQGDTRQLVDEEAASSEHHEEGEHGEGGGHDDHGFGEIMIHQTIETIEFVLGMVSNTASYLRLWALSLAHGQLSEVFWEKALLGFISDGNPGGVFVGFAVFGAVTFAVIIAMDVLECFLHALRLHWVEFQNKFYKADGYKFNPLSIPSLLKKVLV